MFAYAPCYWLYSIYFIYHDRITERHSRYRDTKGHLLGSSWKNLQRWRKIPLCFLRMYLQYIVLQLRGGQVGQGDPGQPAAVGALRQAASTPGPRYTEVPTLPLVKATTSLTSYPMTPTIQSTSNIIGTATITQHHTTTAHCSPPRRKGTLYMSFCARGIRGTEFQRIWVGGDKGGRYV